MCDEIPKRGDMQRERSRMSIVLDQTEKKSPRLFNIITVIIIPLVILICLALLCGHFLAVLESGNELDTLHDKMVSFISTSQNDKKILEITYNTYESCLDGCTKNNTDQLIVGTELKKYIDICKEDGLKDSKDLTKEIDDKKKIDLASGISLHWNRCFYDGNKTELLFQTSLYLENWLDVWLKSYRKNLSTKSENEATYIADEDAKVAMRDNCSVNSAGGAMFWFTIMTTIGYGNTAPVTKGGRALVFTLGFVSILLFGAISSAAGYVSLTIADDFFNTIKFKRLIKGLPSVLFWLVVLGLWILVLPSVEKIYRENRFAAHDISVPLEEAVWWSYVSITTTGFGDHFIPHDTFLPEEMAFIPLLMLIGFVFMANFLLKLSDLISEKLKEYGITDDESLNFLLTQSNANVGGKKAPLDQVLIAETSDDNSLVEDSIVLARNQMKKEKSRVSIVLDEAEKKVPRLFNVIVVIIIPLFLLICLAMLCGHFLAVLESGSELDTLHDTMVSFIDWRRSNENISKIVENTYEGCLDDYIKKRADQLIVGSELRDYIDNCKKDGLEYARAWEEEIVNNDGQELLTSLTLNWNRCFYEGNETELPSQGVLFGSNWIDVWEKSYVNNGMMLDNTDAIEVANQVANTAMMDNCEVNTAGGALFWFTIMTTIGYGNTAPVTKGGRALVYTAGFVSILIFTALTGAAGYVFLTIADDFFKKLKLKFLMKGWPSVSFWFVVYWLWILVLAGVRAQFHKDRYGGYDSLEPLEDRVWWAFITVTTVGLGDFYFPHETFLLKDMWWIPLPILLGFVLLANFLLKLAVTISDTLKKRGITDDESLHHLLSQRRNENKIDNAVPLDEEA